ncbi:tumor necrosis factor receptor superfamily member 11B [Pelodytes ibericus]
MFRIISCCMLLLVFDASDAEETDSPKYSHYDTKTFQHLLCDQCPPGTYVARDCTADSETECEPCPPRHFANTWTSSKECQFCSTVCKELQYVTQECNQTHNRMCECIAGQYLDLEFCVSHTKCPLGYGVVKLGTPDTDTVCEKCPKGMFSNVTSARAGCQRHKECNKWGVRTVTRGDSQSDTVCQESVQQSTHNCELDVTLCEEALFRLCVDRPENWLTILAQGLPGTMVTRQQIEWIKLNYDPRNQSFYLFKLWKEQNKGQSSRRYFQGLETCERGVAKQFGNLNVTSKDLMALMQSLPGKKVEKEDLESTLKMCDRPKIILKLLNLWRIKNEGDTVKALNQLKTRQLTKVLRRRMKKLERFLNSDSMYRVYQKFLEIIGNRTQPGKEDP